MAKKAMDDLLKRRMSAAQQASELQVTDEAYEKLFREAPPAAKTRICDVPLDKLTPFHTADIGFKPYTPAQLKAFAEQLNEEGLMVRIIASQAQIPMRFWRDTTAPMPPVWLVG